MLEREAVAERLRAAGCVFADDEARLLCAEAGTAARRESLLRRREAGEPLEHVLGWAAFAGMRVAVGPGVFVPRRRSEFVVECASTCVTSGDIVLDLCCGSGALGLALACRVPGIDLHAVDIDRAAVRVAAANLAPMGARVYAGDLFAPVPDALRGRVRCVLVNAPYVPSASIALLPVEAREHEPLRALDGGEDGLAVQRRIAAGVGRWLAPGGAVFVETGASQAVLSAEIVAAAGLGVRILRSAARGATVVRGTRTRRGV